MNSINPIWLRYGILFGIISILFSIIFFYVFPIGLGKQAMFSFGIMIIFLVLAGNAEKKLNDGILSYGEALKTTFLTGFTGMVISGLFSLILMNLIDPSLVDKLTEQTIEMTRSMMESFGLPEDQVEQAMEDAESKMVEAYTPLNQILSILQSAIIVVILSAIVSIFIKKDADPSKINVNDIGETGV
jgi:hypothetical protein